MSVVDDISRDDSLEEERFLRQLEEERRAKARAMAAQQRAVRPPISSDKLAQAARGFR